MLFGLFIKKWDSENFKLQRTAMRFSANIIWLLVYLFAKNLCLRGSNLMVLYLEPSQPRRVGEAGKKTPIFPAGKVAIWIAKQSAASQIYGYFEMVSPPREQVYYGKNNEV